MRRHAHEKERLAELARLREDLARAEGRNHELSIAVHSPQQQPSDTEDLEAELNDIPPAVVMPSIDPVDEVRPEDAQVVAWACSARRVANERGAKAVDAGGRRMLV